MDIELTLGDSEDQIRAHKARIAKLEVELEVAGILIAEGMGIVAELQAQLKEQEWVSVEDGPPEEGEDVFILTDYFMATSAKYKNKEYVRICSCRRCDGFTIGSVTHYMKIPTLP